MTAKPPRPPATIRIRKSDGTEADVARLAYIDAKTAQLKESGFTGVTKKLVRVALDDVLAKKTNAGPIAFMIEADIVLPTEEQK